MALEREINVDTLEIDGTEVTATAAELNALDGLTATVAELNYLDIAALGTGAASKAVVLDSGEDYTWPAAGRLTYGGTAITSTGAELNILDGVTATTAEINILSGVTSTAAELNILDGVTSTAAELNILDGVTSTAAELNYLDIATLGTGAASKAVVLDAGEDYTWPATGQLTYGGTAITSTGAELNILDGVTATTAEINILSGVTSTAAELNILDGVTSTAAELNILDGVTSTAAELNYLDIATLGTGAASKAVVLDAGEDYTWPATGVLTYGGTGITATGAEINYLDIATLGTGAASKAVVLDAGEDYTWPATGILTYGGGAINATGAEITRACDVSSRLVSLTATAAITEAAHEGRELYVTGSALATYTLPEATGSGARYRFIIGEVNTNNTVITTADATNCSFYGSVNILDLDAATQAAYAPAATDELITLNGTTTGGQIGDFIEVVDMATDKWMVFGQLQCPTGSNPATPFSGV